MYCTGGGAWISDDLLNWSFQRVANVPVAPHVVKYNGSFYMCGNSGPLFKADNPLGPFTSIGEWKNPPDVAGGWSGPFDMDIYIDDDNKPYLYFPGRGDRRHLRRAARPQRPHEIRRPAQAPLRLQQGPRLGTLRRDERVHRRGVDRRPVDAETQRHVLSAILRLRAPSGRPMPRDTTPRSRRWARSPMRPTTRSSAGPTASSPVPPMAASLKDPTRISGSSTPSFSPTRPADGASAWIVSPSTKTATWR